MAPTPPPSSTYVDIDAPDAPNISTPTWPSPAQPQSLSGLPLRGPTMYNISTPYSFTYPGTQVRMLSPALGGNTPVQTLTWAPELDNIQLCTSTDVSSPSSVAQRDLLGILPTPGREIQHFSTQVQGNWDNQI